MKNNILLMTLGMLLVAALYAALELFVPSGSGLKDIEIEIPKGATFRQAADILLQNNMIRDKNIFLLLGKITGADRKIRAGFYSLWGSMPPFDIFQLIRTGKIIEYEIRVLEGDSLIEISDAFAKTGIVSRDAFLALARNPSFLSSYGIEGPSAEGYIFPDTYIIPKGVSPEDALGLMIDRMRTKLSEAMSAGTTISMSENEILTMASIVEKEAVTDSERELISAVYHNRLRKRIPLQADPTSIYGVKSSKERITSEDIRRKTPYNTYVIKGLPPGPIASPGVKSLAAALRPAKVNYLFFVSNNDGTHHFSETAGEHAEAVKEYRQKKQEMKSKGNEDGNS